MSNFIKSPLNFVGGKYKLLPQILPLLPDDIDNFVDLFAGGCNVGVNIKANKIHFNDTQHQVMELISYLFTHDLDEMLIKIDKIIGKYNLNRENKDGYLSLRKDYNTKNKHPLMLYCLIAHSFTNQIRFNKKYEFNMPFGKRTFNDRLRNVFINFVNELQSKNTEFHTLDFRKYNIDNLNKDDFVYIDPPYLVGVATYNEQNGWTEEDESDLYNFIDKLNNKGIRFALSNVFESKGKVNETLQEWAKKYNVHYLNNDYANCNYQTKNRDKSSTVEVLITNYQN